MDNTITERGGGGGSGEPFQIDQLANGNSSCHISPLNPFLNNSQPTRGILSTLTLYLCNNAYCIAVFKSSSAVIIKMRYEENTTL